MIAFDLQCSNGHAFEGWFEDGEGFEKQQGQGLIACPVCNDNLVMRIPSTFAIKTSRPTPPATRPPADSQPQVAEISRKIQEYVARNFDDVGCDFAKEALKIHYGVSEPRNIRGQSTHEEEKILEKEGIDFLKFPLPIRSDNET